MPQTTPTAPIGWTPTHDAFIKDLYLKGEDAESIRILLEAEFPAMRGRISKIWIRERVLRL
ncbi:MAG: hypothetical protein M1834_003951 [Cirrosporium novae-zelandiae]|nr:MAG: hypothetical protein M1834_003951 [Cirrosporium novae-zelandiae]